MLLNILNFKLITNRCNTHKISNKIIYGKLHKIPKLMLKILILSIKILNLCNRFNLKHLSISIIQDSDRVRKVGWYECSLLQKILAYCG